MALNPKIEVTEDGSNTLVHPKFNTHYHSVFGAIQESNHVFINSGLKFQLPNLQNNRCRILEVGFGSGLNAFNTLISSEELLLNIEYVGVEQYPISLEIALQLNFPTAFKREDLQSTFNKMHVVEWEKPVKVLENFTLEKRQQDIFNLKDENDYDLIFYDAFGPGAQPELWTAPIFETLFKSLKDQGVLVTYCAQGAARRAMQSVGFTVQRCPGPPSKRHMLRAIK
jgi:tRNA U34 5-methylaminomethyl-2-thiouridine-forming methyltransferase MnmC